MVDISFETFLSGLQSLSAASTTDEAVQPLVKEAKEAADRLLSLPVIDRNTLAEVIREHPTWVPFLASCVGLGLEQLKRQLQHRLKTSGWITLARKQPERLIADLDDTLSLVRVLDEQRRKQWNFADILIERLSWSQRSASLSIRRGRKLEDVVEQTVLSLNLPYTMRCRFVGRNGQNAPCDFAIPAANSEALIVGAVKGFDSTGSKLSDAVREIEAMADTRLPRQFVFAFIDGIGWLGRKADLRRIHDLLRLNAVDGLYSLSRLEEFRSDLEQAARRLGLLS